MSGNRIIFTLGTPWCVANKEDCSLILARSRNAMCDKLSCMLNSLQKLKNKQFTTSILLQLRFTRGVLKYSVPYLPSTVPARMPAMRRLFRRPSTKFWTNVFDAKATQISQHRLNSLTHNTHSMTILQPTHGTLFVWTRYRPSCSLPAVGYGELCVDQSVCVCAETDCRPSKPCTSRFCPCQTWCERLRCSDFHRSIENVRETETS